MLVPAMTQEEIRREIEKDYPIFYRKIHYVIHDIEKDLSKTAKQQGFVKYFDYWSKYKNHWIYELCISQKTSSCSSMLVFNTARGNAGITVTNDMSLVYHTPHFFARYNERCKLGLSTFYEVVRVYINDNSSYQFEKIEEIAPGIFTIFCNIHSGIILGLYNRNLKIIKAKTFLPNEMLSKKQNEIKKQLINELYKYTLTSGSSLNYSDLLPNF